MEEGKQIIWTWEMYNVSVYVIVKKIEQDQRILMEWSSVISPNETTNVKFVFMLYDHNFTYVNIINHGFSGDEDKQMGQALDATGGFTTVLDTAKAWLEHNINLNLILDKFPKGLKKH